MNKTLKLVSMLLCMGTLPIMGHATTSAAAVNAVEGVQQNSVCKGVVKDPTGETVIGAAVMVKGTTNGTVTDIDGNFSLSNVKKGDVIEISFVGYQTQTIKWNGQDMIVTMKDDTQALEEVVVTAYGGKQLRSKVTNSISKVDNSKLTAGVHSNPAQALSGAVSGLRVIQNSGNPGAQPQLVLRGGTNFDGKGSPLVIVDGQLRTSGLADINPEDIESMEVMKDAGATAIYGARASNGVILVTTKSGKSGHAEVNLKARVGLNYANTPHDFLEARDYLTYIRRAYDRTPWAPKDNLTGKTPLGTGNDINDPGMQWNVMGYKPEYDYLVNQHGWEVMEDPINPGQKLIFKNTVPRDYNFNTPAITQDYNLNINGGNEKGTYYAGLGYNKSEGIPVTSFYERFSFTFNGSYNVTKWLKSTSNFSFNRANWDSMPGSQSSEANYFGRILSVPTTARYEDEAGNALLGPNTWDGNQTYQPEKWTEDNQSDKFSMIQKFDIDFGKGFSLTASGNWFYDESVQEWFTKDFQTNQEGTKFNTGRSTGFQFGRNFSQTYNAVVNYNGVINRDHSLGVMLGVEYYSVKNKGVNASGSGAPTDDFADLNLTDNGEGKRAIDSWHSEKRIMSYLGRVNYDFQGKYLLSGVFRYDGYSTLLDNRWGFFPGISAGWVFGKESFIKNAIPAMSFGKLRLSYGVNGNATGISAYELQGNYGTVKYNGNTGFLIGALPNPSLRWEKTKTFELGLDQSYFENRLNANITYYNRLTSDKYAAFKLPPSTGFSSITNNNGEFRNQGIEIEIGGHAIKTKNFNWHLNGNISFNKNIIVKLPDNPNERNRQGGFEIYTGNGNEKIWVAGYQEGQEPGRMVGYKNLGVFKNDEEINKAYPSGKVISGNAHNKIQYTPEAWAKLTDAERARGVLLRPGDLQWADINGDGMIDQYDQVDFGNTTPHWTGGLTSTMTWKGFTLYLAMDFAFGYKFYDGVTPWYMSCGQGTYNLSSQAFDTWSPENPNGHLPQYMYADFLGPANWGRVSDLNMYNGGYVAFRELALTYSFPKEWVNKIFCQKIDLSVTGQNLGYICPAPTARPEEAWVPGHNSNGLLHGSAYPMPRTVLFGLNVTF